MQLETMNQTHRRKIRNARMERHQSFKGGDIMAEEVENLEEGEEWEEISTNFWTPQEEGDELIGVVKGTESTQYGEAIKIQKGSDIVLLNYRALNSALKGMIGEKVRIVYRETVKSGSGFEYKDFDLFRAKK